MAPRITGSVPYPAGDGPAALDALAVVLDRAAGTFASSGDGLVQVGAEAARSWQGEAAVTFVDHVNDRAHTLELTTTQVRRAATVVREYAAALRDNEGWYERHAQRERVLRRVQPPPEDAVRFALDDQRRCVAEVDRLGQRYGGRLADIGNQILQYAERGFVDVGDHLDVVDGLQPFTGRFLIADALEATEDKRIGTDEIQVRRLDDGTYVLVLPGVTDLSNGGALDELRGNENPENTPRKTLNASPTAVWDGPNPYAEMVKMALRRAGVPDGATVTIVGHSYGAYTAMDLARDPSFNRPTGDGYNLNVRRVVAVAADTDWKVPRVPARTDVVVLNSRTDLVYQTEAQLDPEADWIWRSDRPRVWPGPGVRPIGPTVSYPSWRRNQVEVEVDAGVLGTKEDGYISGHHPKNYSPFVRNAPVRSPMRPILDGTGDARVVESYNVRVPDRVPRLPTGPQPR